MKEKDYKIERNIEHDQPSDGEHVLAFILEDGFHPQWCVHYFSRGNSPQKFKIWRYLPPEPTLFNAWDNFTSNPDYCDKKAWWNEAMRLINRMDLQVKI